MNYIFINCFLMLCAPCGHNNLRVLVAKEYFKLNEENMLLLTTDFNSYQNILSKKLNFSLTI